VDRVLLVTSVREPKFRRGIVDRFLVAAASQGLEASLVINKVDLATDEKSRSLTEEASALYRSLGVPVILTSAFTGEGLDELPGALGRSGSVLVGHSGVGKSTLLNALDPSLGLRARPVNRKTGKGTHTTSVAVLLTLSSGIEVIDTPGVRELDIIDLAPSDLEACFPEFLPLIENCEKDNCSHREEPGCAVKAAIDSGEVDPKRYESYLAIFDSLMKAERPYAG
jgi:ribosome biogenesis GTPase